jgi:hypothetical protein
VGWIDHPEYPNGGYVRFEHRGKLFLAHRVAWFLHYGEWPPEEIDHIDGNGQNNKIENLRLSDRSQNMCNRGAYKCNSLGLKGVRADGNKYSAQLSHRKKVYWLGMHDTAEEAAKAYDRKAIEIHGEYAKTNFPIEDYFSG